MKRFILACALSPLLIVYAQESLEDIEVTASDDTETIKDIYGEEIKSADTAEVLFKKSASAWLVRRSAIANDVIVRGMKKDNLNVTIDGMKIYGACPNRMDPPFSHVFTNNIESIAIQKGPFSVEDFGALGANIKIETIAPKEGFGGQIDLGVGSWGYEKKALMLHGGNETFKFILSGSDESSETYEDGNGDDFFGQIQREIDKATVPAKVAYQDRYKTLKAYQKQTLLAKLFWDISPNEQLRLSYTANRGDDILYPSSKMDALYDDSDLFSLSYNAKNIGKFSKEFLAQLYRSNVDHSMSTKYRESALLDSNPMLPGIQRAFMTHTLTTQTDGIRLKNRFDSHAHEVTVGFDYMKRNWNGKYYKNDIPLNIASNGRMPLYSINDVDTTNYGMYLSDRFKKGLWEFEGGIRFSTTEIISANPDQPSNTYDTITGYLTAWYQADHSLRYFAGLGRSSRVPDAKELYWIGSMGNQIGTPNLQNTLNNELDLGVEIASENSSFNAKVFYSKIENFIAYNATKTMLMMGKPVAYNAYENVDATLWGLELGGTWMINDKLYTDWALAYQRGVKDRPLSGQSDTDMPEIPPLKLTALLHYDYSDLLSFEAELIASDAWRNFDAQNGEQYLSGFGVLNLKATKRFQNGIELIVGVDNLTDETYALTNTYKDQILLPTVSPQDNVILLNEPGRYFYANLRYRF